MAGLFDKQSNLYLTARPNYPNEWYSKLAALTPHHSSAWDVGTGNGQAALGVAEYYEKVIGTDVSEAQLKHAIPHPKVSYIHTPLSMSNDELISMLGGEGSIDLITVAQAVHWFDLPNFYSLVNRLLRKPGGVIAVWGYNGITIDSSVDLIQKRFDETNLPFWDPNIHYIFEGYRTLPFPFKCVGIGSEKEPLSLDMQKELSFEGFLGMLRSLSAVVTAKDQGIDLLSDAVVNEFKSAWGGSGLVREVTYKAFMLAGAVKM